MWVYNISIHSWLNLDSLGMGKFSSEVSLFRLSV
jgi:hypothetical protein